ncbi:MAG TPA: hypothetical protein VMR52_03260 [Dehalococcoidia bacterium]|nr:hypothetical protein [Dehalococcoidia bacterium]
MAEEKYQCWGPHKDGPEFLDEQVVAVIQSPPTSTVLKVRPLNVLVAGAPKVESSCADDEDEIMVTCSLGHDNLFCIKKSLMRRTEF